MCTAPWCRPLACGSLRTGWLQQKPPQARGPHHYKSLTLRTAEASTSDSSSPATTMAPIMKLELFSHTRQVWGRRGTDAGADRGFDEHVTAPQQSSERRGVWLPAVESTWLVKCPRLVPAPASSHAVLPEVSARRWAVLVKRDQLPFSPRRREGHEAGTKSFICVATS